MLLWFGQLIDSLSTDVVTSTFQNSPCEIATDDGGKSGGKNRHVVFCQLVLQSLGVGGYNDSFVRCDRWDEIAERLAGSSSCLNNEMSTIFDCLCNR